MTYIGNTPLSETVIRLEARKSFALGLSLRDLSGFPLNITGVTLKIIAKIDPAAADATNFIANSTAEHLDEVGGMARFNIQATDVNVAPGEYPFAITMTS